MRKLYSSLFATIYVAAALLGCPKLSAADGVAGDNNSSTAGPAWLQNTYTWKDASGTTHTSTYAEKATITAQIGAMVTAMYNDPAVPGLKRFATSVQRDSSGNTTITYANVAYPKCKAQPTEDGLTMLLVKYKNSFVTAGQTSLDYVESVEVLRNFVRIEDGANPGTLFNIDADLNKFSVMSKGKPRAVYNPPFYYWEEIAPVDTNFGPEALDAYRKMTGYTDENGVYHEPQKYPILHICSSIQFMGHPCVMLNNNDPNCEPAFVHANIMAFIPDYRLADVTSDPYHDIPHTRYNTTDHIPYFFMYTIRQAEPVVTLSQAQAHVADVTLEWTSSLKSVTGEAEQEVEEFCVLRRLSGTQEWEVVPQSQITIEQEGTSKDPESEVMVDRALDGTVRVIVHEAMEPDNREMEYMIDGRLKGSDFSMIESNVQHAYIDGYDVYSEPRIRITMAHTSHYGSAEQRNAYTDRIGIILNLRSEEIPMIRGHLSFDAAAPTRLRLARFTDPAEADLRDISHAADVPADLTIGWASSPGADGWYEYPVTGTLDGELFTATLYSRSIGSPTDDLAAPILDSKVESAQILSEGSTDTPYTSELLVLTDRWGVSTATEADNHTYAYRVFASCLNITNYAEGILSDTRSLGMITLPIGAGCNPYTLDEITADTDGALAPNESQVSFTVGRLPKVDHAEIRAVTPATTTASTPANPAGTAASEPLLAQLTRSVQNGAYTLTARAGADASQPLERVGASTGETGTYTFATPEVLRGKTIEMVTHLTNGNTYGAPRVYAPAMPTMEITPLEEPWYLCGPRTLSTSALWSWHSGAQEGDPDFARLGFRAWSGEGSDGITGLETTPFYDDFDAAAQPTAAVATPVTASYAPRHTPASRSAQATTDDPDTRQVDHTFNITQAVTPDGLPGATLAYRVRHYSEEPWNPGSGNYIVTDAPVVWQVKDTATGVEAIDPEADTAATDAGTNGTWYTIQGQLLPTAPTAPGLYIRRTSHGATKVRL